MCARNDFGGLTKSNLVEDEWSWQDVLTIFDPRLINLQNVMFCGTHGDPCVAKNSLPAIEHIKRHTDATVEFFSNASLRKPEYWYELGKLLNEKKPDHTHYRKNDLAVFSVDGLGDTNHIYRRGTNFERIMENAEAFLKAGGIARWDFIVFKHNEHQVEEAQKLAEKMGFKQFRIRRTSRFDYSPDDATKWRIKDKNGSIVGYLEPPSDTFRNQEGDKLANLKEHYGGLTNYFDAVPINCLYKNQFKRIYVNAYAQVFPCCYISNDVYPASNQVTQDTKEKVFDRWGYKFNSLRYNDWNDILNHEWFRHELEDSWNERLNNGKLQRCARTCGVDYKPITSQSEDVNLGNR
jgi:hypothetical protein